MDARRLITLGRALNSVCAAALFLAVVSVSQPANAEIPAVPDVPTSKVYLEQYRRFLERTVLEAYRAKRDENGKVANDDDPADTFIRLWIDSAENESPDLDPFEKQARLAIDAGCKDPMFAYCYGRILENYGKSDEAAKYLKEALDNLDAKGVEASIAASAARHLRIVQSDLKRNDEAEPLVDREISCLTTTVADGPYLPEEQRLLYDHVSKALEKHPIEKVQPMVEQINRHLYPWVFQMASGQMEIRLAWKARGGGWAAEVTEEGWKGFEKHMVAACEHLTEACNLNPEWPEAPTKMITVVMAGHAEEEETARQWFDRAVAAEFDHLPAYNALLWSLMPRWGGSHQDLYALGRECLDTGRFDTRVPYIYVQAFDHIVGDIGSTFDYYKTPGVYEDLQTLADGYLGEPTMKSTHDWYRAFKVAAAVRCERWDEARQFLDKIQGEPDEGAFARFGLKSAEVLDEVVARSAEFAQETTAAEELAASGKFDEAKAKFEDLAVKAGDRQEVTTYFRGRLRGVEFDDEFAKGEWTKLPFDKQLSGWRNQGGNWTVDDNGRLVARPQRDGLRLTYDKKIGTRFELRGKVTLVKRPYNQSNIGIYFGQVTGEMPYALLMYFDEDYAALFNQKEVIARNPVKVDDTNSFRVERWDSTISAFVNDKRVAEAVEIEPGGSADSEVFALGGNYWYDGPTLRFEGLEIRKLEKPPEGTSAATVEAEGDATVEQAEDVEPAETSDASDVTESNADDSP